MLVACGDPLPTDTAADAADTADTAADTADTAADTAPPAWTGSDLSLQDCDATPRPLASLVGPAGLVLAVGAAWCGPCQEDAPVMEAFRAEHPDIGVAQVLVEGSDAQPITRLECAEWAESFALGYPVLVDPLFLTEPLVGTDGFPVHVVFAPDGTEVLRAPGAFDGAAVLAAL